MHCYLQVRTMLIALSLTSLLRVVQSQINSLGQVAGTSIDCHRNVLLLFLREHGLIVNLTTEVYMAGKIALEEHSSTALNNKHWNAKGEEGRNGREYAQDVERRLLDPELCVREMNRAGIEICIMSLTSPGVQSIVDPKQAVELARTANDYSAEFIQKFPGRFFFLCRSRPAGPEERCR